MSFSCLARCCETVPCGLPPNALEERFETMYSNAQGNPVRAKNVSGLREYNEDSQTMSPNLPHAISVEHAIQSLTAKTDLRVVFESLPQDERDAILDPKGTNKLPTKDVNKPNPPSNATAEQVDAAELKGS
ncbi:hypothetical protein P692DRAFT_20890590 [Suillus brevipes Sb2]|nr:hypothetical protein P692DRAFT_20890590 [Suillus brevipes Sb2]